MSSMVLKLDAAFRPVEVIPWQDYVSLYLRGNVTVIEVEQGEFWRSPSLEIPKALVVQVHHFVRLKDHIGPHAIKKILYLRDNGQCQACGIFLTFKDATREHLVPQSRAKELGLTNKQLHSYSNCVIFCGPCNLKKGNKLPGEAGIKLLKTPKRPTYVPLEVHGVKHRVQKQYVDSYLALHTKDPTVSDVKEIPWNKVNEKGEFPGHS